MLQRYLIIGAVAIVILGGGVWAYYAFFANTASVAVSTGGSLPSAGNVASNPPGTTGVGSVASSATPQRVTGRLVRIDAGPVVPGEAAVDVQVLADGSVATTTRVAASTTPDIAVKYLERQSGNIFSYLFRAGTITRTSDKTVPAIEEAVWAPGGSLVFARYLSGTSRATINTYALYANGASGYFLPQNIITLVASSTSLLALSINQNGSAATVENLDGTHGATAFSSALTSLRASFLGKTQYLAFTKPSATLAGYAFSVSASGAFTRIAGPLNGLVALASPSGRYVLVSYSAEGSMRLELVDLKAGQTYPLPVATIADKCVWTSDDSGIYCGIPVNPPTNFAYPDDWYQGAIAFSDRIWKIDVAGRFAGLALDFPKETGKALDAQALAIDPNVQVLVFENKNDASLWAYEL